MKAVRMNSKNIFRTASSFLDHAVSAAKIDVVLERKNLPDAEKRKIRELNDRLVNKSKYVDFLAKNYTEQDIVDLINDFETKLNKLGQKDINQYDVEKLRDTLGKAETVKTKTEQKTETKTKGVKKIYENGDYTVFHVTTPEASCFYGAGTKWCISGREINFFHNYNEKANIYFLISKKLKKEDPLYKMAVTRDFEDKLTVFNAKDEPDSLPENREREFRVFQQQAYKPEGGSGFREG